MKNITLISSSSYHVINNKIKEIIKDNKNITNFSLLDVSIYDCIEDASYFGLFEENRVIIIKDVKYFGGNFKYEEETAALLNFLSNLDESITIIFVCDSISKTKDITKKVINLGATIIELNDLSDEVIKEMITEYTKSLNISIEEKAYKKLLENSLNNIDIAIEEINKLSNIDKTITEKIIDEYGIKLEDIDSFEFCNIVVAKKFNEAFEMLDKLLNSGVEPIAIIGLLASKYISMYMVRDAIANNLTDEEIAKKFGYSSTGRIYYLKKDSKIYTLDELKEIIIKLSDLDLKIKTGYSPVYELKEFLLNL